MSRIRTLDHCQRHAHQKGMAAARRGLSRHDSPYCPVTQINLDFHWQTGWAAVKHPNAWAYGYGIGVIGERLELAAMRREEVVAASTAYVQGVLKRLSAKPLGGIA